MLHTFTFTEIFFELSTFSVRKEKLFAEACRDTCHIVLADEFIIFVTRFKVCFHGCTYNSVSIIKVVQTRWNKWEQWEQMGTVGTVENLGAVGICLHLLLTCD